MHSLEMIVALNERHDESAQLAHSSKLDLSANQGPVFPIVEYRIGDDDYRSLAPFGQGCQLSASDYAGQRRNSYRLKRLEELTNEALKGLKASDGFTVCYANTEYNAKSGYMVSFEGNEVVVSKDDPGHDIYQYLFEHRGHLHSAFCVGGWVHDGQLYLDVSAWYEDYNEAVNAGKFNKQLAIWDCAGNTEITL